MEDDGLRYISFPARNVTKCQECGRRLAADSPDLRIELTYDDEPLFYCLSCWQRECGECGE